MAARDGQVRDVRSFWKCLEFPQIIFKRFSILSVVSVGFNLNTFSRVYLEIPKVRTSHVRNLLGQLADPNIEEHGTSLTPVRAALTVAKASSAHDEVLGRRGRVFAVYYQKRITQSMVGRCCYPPWVISSDCGTEECTFIDYIASSRIDWMFCSCSSHFMKSRVSVRFRKKTLQVPRK